MKKSCRLSYIGLSLGIKNDRLIDFIINMFIALFKNLWQAFHILLYCFAGYFRNPELLITNYRWQKYTHSLHWFGSDIMRTLELHAYNLYMFNYSILVKNRREKREIQQLTSCEFCLLFWTYTQERAWNERLEGIFPTAISVLTCFSESEYCNSAA